jgi:hypothetical protein
VFLKTETKVKSVTMIVMLGDSNYRNTIHTNKDRLVASVGEEVSFAMTTSNETLKIHLESLKDETKIVVIGCPLNEVVQRVNKAPKKGRDEVLRSVLEEQNKIVTASALNKKETLDLIVPPFYRANPEWLKNKIRLGIFYSADFIKTNENSPWNVCIANPVEINDEDLNDDNVHLNDIGKEKLYKSLEADILTCKDNLGEGRETMDWASQISTQSQEPPTPRTIRKRIRSETDEESIEEERGGKKAKLDSVMDMLKSLVKEIKEERTSNKSEITDLNSKVEEKSKEVEVIKEDINKLKKEGEKDVEITAEIREDLDSLENENLKLTVIVRKLKTEKEVPKDKKLLRSFIQDESRKLVAKILDEEAVNLVKYGATLYATIDPTKKDNMAGLIPPFKIGFSSKEVAVKFRDTAVKKAKEEGSEFKNTYFTFFQSPGTRVRVMLMWSVAGALKTDANETWVTQNNSKPLLQVKEGNKIVKSLTFVKTMLAYKDKVSQKAIDEATKLAKKHFSGKLEKTFIVLKD